MTDFLRLASLVMLAAFIAPGAAANSYAMDHSLRVAQISVFQKGGDTFSGMLTYSPAFRLGLPFRADLGASMFKSAAGKKDRFLVLNARMLLDLRLSDSLAWEVGPGVQQWFDNGNLKFLAGTNFVIHSKSRILGIADQLFLGYNAVLIKNLLTHQVLVGFGI